jgi:DNA-binding NarL/FixJ family response regulator
MVCASRIPVMISHRMPLVTAGLEAALGTRSDFEIVSPGERAGVSIGSRTKFVLVADTETGVHMVNSESSLGGRVLIVTPDASEASVRCALQAGIRGYLLLASTLDVVAQAIRCVYDGGTMIDPVVTSKVVGSRATRELTDRELDVLGQLMLGLRDKAIAKILAIGLGTVKAHMKRIRAKLDAATRTEAMVIAQRRGLVPEEVTARLLEKAGTGPQSAS